VAGQESYDFQILNHIDQHPDTTQADLATQLDVAVGSVNWYLKRLVNKGYIKVKQMERRRLRYLLTPQGVSEKARLTKEFMQMSFQWYRLAREDTRQFLLAAREAGYETVSIEADGDLADVIALSCMEAHIRVSDDIDAALPVFKVENLRVVVAWPGGGTLSAAGGQLG
jgi:DNA-binding MarR family transcriptional regulator